MLQRLTHWLRRPVPAKRAPRTMLQLEGLGQRITPSAGVQLHGGLLRIEGTAGADVVQISAVDANVVVDFNGTTSTFAAAKVKSILFHGEGGNDTFTNNSSIRATIFGDNGDDKLTGGSGNDLIHGGKGNDDIQGGGGNDMLMGELGDDSLSGGSGNDMLQGGNGNDDLSGDDGNDMMSGGNGADDLNGNAGDDRLNGDAGDDRLNGGSGRDSLNGGWGVDHSIHDLSDRSDNDERHDGELQADGSIKIEGTLTAINGNQFTIAGEHGNTVTVNITADTVLEKNGAHVAITDFVVGDPVEARYNPDTLDAAKVESGEDNGDDHGGNDNGQTNGKVEGMITAVGADSVTIKTASGKVVMVTVTSGSKLERNDKHVTLDAFKVGDSAEAKFDPTTLEASKVEAVGP